MTGMMKERRGKKKTMYYEPYKEPFTNLCKGEPVAKKKNHENPGPPVDLKKFQGPPFCHENYQATPIEKHVDSIFTDKFVVIFFKVTLTRVKNFKVPPFCIRSPNKC